SLRRSSTGFISLSLDYAIRRGPTKGGLTSSNPAWIGARSAIPMSKLIAMPRGGRLPLRALRPINKREGGAHVGRNRQVANHASHAVVGAQSAVRTMSTALQDRRLS